MTIVNIREDIIRKWFGMWLSAEDTGISDIFTKDAVYIESWGPEYHGATSIRHWFDPYEKGDTPRFWDEKAKWF